MAETLFASKELNFLKALKQEGVEFMLVGLAAATLQGAPVVTQDVDLWFKNLSDPRLRRALEKVGGIYVPSFQHHPPAIAGAGLELFDIVLNMSGLGSFEEEEKYCLSINLDGVSVPVLALERILASKTAENREKDKLVLPVLRDTLVVSKKSPAKKKPK